MVGIPGLDGGPGSIGRLRWVGETREFEEPGLVGELGSFEGFGTIGGSGLTGLVGDPELDKGSRLVGDSGAFEKSGLVDDPRLVRGSDLVEEVVT